MRPTAVSTARRGSMPSCVSGMASGSRAGKRVERLMRQASLPGLVVRERGRTTIRVPGVRALTTSYSASSGPTPDVLWIADLTYLRTWEGWLNFNTNHYAWLASA